MYPRQIAASITIGLLVLVLIVRLIQKGRLDIAYSWLWLAVGVGMIVVVIRYKWLVALSRLIGAVTPTTTLFLLGILTLLLMCLQFSMVISRHRREIKTLTQRLALLLEESGGQSRAAAAEVRDDAPQGQL